MTVKEIVHDWLRNNGYDGLFNDGECGCSLIDLNMCDCPFIADCEPGYSGPDPDGECNYWIYPTKAAVKDAEQRNVVEKEQGNEDAQANTTQAD